MKDKILPGLCRKCQKKIHPKENYCRLTEWKQGNLLSEGWYHVACFREGMHGNIEEKKIKAEAQDLINRTKNVLSRIEVYA